MEILTDVMENDISILEVPMKILSVKDLLAIGFGLLLYVCTTVKPTTSLHIPSIKVPQILHLQSDEQYSREKEARYDLSQAQTGDLVFLSDSSPCVLHSLRECKGFTTNGPVYDFWLASHLLKVDHIVKKEVAHYPPYL